MYHCEPTDVVYKYACQKLIMVFPTFKHQSNIQIKRDLNYDPISKFLFVSLLMSYLKLNKKYLVEYFCYMTRSSRENVIIRLPTLKKLSNFPLDTWDLKPITIFLLSST